MIRRPPRSTQSRSSAASDVYKRQLQYEEERVREAQEHHPPTKCREELRILDPNLPNRGIQRRCEDVHQVEPHHSPNPKPRSENQGTESPDQSPPELFQMIQEGHVAPLALLQSRIHSHSILGH